MYSILCKIRVIIKLLLYISDFFLLIFVLHPRLLLCSVSTVLLYVKSTLYLYSKNRPQELFIIDLDLGSLQILISEGYTR